MKGLLSRSKQTLISILVLGLSSIIWWGCQPAERPEGDWNASQKVEDRSLFSTHFPAEEFTDRRDRVYDQIGSQAIAVLAGAPAPDGYEHFRQYNSFYYLTGVEAPHAYLILDGQKREATLYLSARDERREYGEGKVLAAEDETLIREGTGIDHVKSVDELLSDLRSVRDRSSTQALYVQQAPLEKQAMTRSMAHRKWEDVDRDPLDQRQPRYQHINRQLQKRMSSLEEKDLTPILDEMRKIKSDRELALIDESMRLQAQVIEESIRSTEVGTTPYELEAIGKYIYQKNGYQGDAYYALVHVGPDAYMNHYHGSVRPAQDGDMILMDYGGDYHYYTSDLARMWPANGRFNQTQKELYTFYLGFYEAVLYNIQKGLTPQEIKQNALVEIDSILAATQFSKPRYRQAAESFVEDYRKSAESAYRGLGHGVGMSVHDVGDYSVPLEEGMVFVIEPQFRVPEDRIYIRLEDMIVVTEDGVEVISDFLPRDIESIEQIMQEEGLLQFQLK
ncbi:MAG: aminopeptidase P N-terminal domain-containing protein [Bacteroidota bacterium]